MKSQPEQFIEAIGTWRQAADELGQNGALWLRDMLDARTLSDLTDVNVFYATRQMRHLMNCLRGEPSRPLAAGATAETANDRAKQHAGRD